MNENFICVRLHSHFFKTNLAFANRQLSGRILMSGLPNAAALNDATSMLQQSLCELQGLVDKSAVHKKKFEFAVNQLRRFVAFLSESKCGEAWGPDQVDAVSKFVKVIEELWTLLCEHQSHCWANPTIENPSSYVAAALTDICGKLRNEAGVICPDAEKFFDPDDPQWLQYHLLDLKGISASFRQYLKTCKDQLVIDLMTERVRSVEGFIKKYENATVAPGLRVFSPIPVNYLSWRLHHDWLQEVKQIGNGASAHVFYGFDKRNGNEVAIKKLKFEKLSGGRLRAFQREVAVLATATHPTVVGFVGATDTPPFCIVTQWMAGGTLYHEIHKYQRLNATMRTIAAFDIARGMQFLHSRHIIHRDLKSLNVLLDSNGHAHICDFGFSRAFNGDETFLTENVGTPQWMAPELLATKNSYTMKVDVYAYGIVLWEIASGQIPYDGLDASQIVGQVLVNDARPPISDRIHPKLRDLIAKCWARNPDARPTFDEIVRRFIKDKIWLDGADDEQVQRYIWDKVDCSEYIENSIESLIEEGHKNPNVLLELTEAFEKDRVPAEFIGSAWDIVEKSPESTDPAILGKLAAMFLNTSLKERAAALMRKLPCNSVPVDLMTKAVEAIPTGSEEFDEDLIIAACKNRAADAAVVYALFPNHIKLTLDIISQYGVSASLKAAVADKCVQFLKSTDTAMVCSVMRCLGKIGEFRRVPIHVIQRQIASRDTCLRNCGLVAGASLALSGVQMPLEVIDVVMEQGQEDVATRAYIVSSCSVASIANRVVTRLVHSDVFSPEFRLRILLMVATKHKELVPAVRLALGEVDMAVLKDKYQRELDMLAEYVK